MGSNTEQLLTQAAGNLGSAALLLHLSADAAKMIFLGLILLPLLFPLLVIVGSRFREETCQVLLAF